MRRWLKVAYRKSEECVRVQCLLSQCYAYFRKVVPYQCPRSTLDLSKPISFQFSISVESRPVPSSPTNPTLSYTLAALLSCPTYRTAWLLRCSLKRLRGRVVSSLSILLKSEYEYSLATDLPDKFACVSICPMLWGSVDLRDGCHITCRAGCRADAGD